MSFRYKCTVSTRPHVHTHMIFIVHVCRGSGARDVLSRVNATRFMLTCPKMRSVVFAPGFSHGFWCVMVRTFLVRQRRRRPRFATTKTACCAVCRRIFFAFGPFKLLRPFAFHGAIRIEGRIRRNPDMH